MSNKLIQAAGGIVCRRADGQWQVLVAGGSAAEPDYWGFPKGHQRSGELIEVTAIREIREETGLRVELLALVGTSQYTCRTGGKTKDKIVYYYLACPTGGKAGKPDGAFRQIRWVSIEQATQLLTYATDKMLLTRSQELLEKTPWLAEILSLRERDGK